LGGIMTMRTPLILWSVLTATIAALSLGPSFAQEAMPDVIGKLIDVYVEQRTEDERFIDTYQRIGIDLFKERVYAANH
jgi:sulfite reductase beta subunit-like hemoprotein